jgi:porin
MRVRCFLLLMALAAPASAQVLNYDSVFESPTLTGDWNGARTRLEDQGIQLGADEILDLLGNPRGGQSQGASLEGRFEVFANIDLGKTLGWPGAIFHVNAYQIHGTSQTRQDIGNLVAASNIESAPATRLFDLWVQQSFFNDAVSLRLGQLAADDEFFVSQYAPLFINSTFGWPSIMGINLPSGGPSYPVARPGARARIAVSQQLVLTTGVFSGDPVVNDAGFDLHMNGDMFAISELAYAMTIFQLPGTMKLGGWIHTGSFSDQRYDAAHVSLADPASNGFAATHRGDYGGYFILDQLLWRRDGTSDSGLGEFFRVGGNPSDRNLIELHMDGGLTLAAPFGRANDTIGIGLSYEQVSATQRDLTDDFRLFTGLPAPTPDLESAVEISYQAQMASWWIVQPDVQWIIHPGGRVLDQIRPSARTGNALVMGLRTAVSF